MSRNLPTLVIASGHPTSLARSIYGVTRDTSYSFLDGIQSVTLNSCGFERVNTIISLRNEAL